MPSVEYLRAGDERLTRDLSGPLKLKHRVGMARGVLLWSALAAPMLLGCGGSGSQTARVQGAVTIDGQPVPADAVGTVIFQTTQGGQGRTVSVPIASGRYDSPETPRGPVRVLIVVQRPTGKTLDNGRGEPAEELANILAPEHASGVDVQIDGNKNDLDFALKGI